LILTKLLRPLIRLLVKLMKILPLKH